MKEQQEDAPSGCSVRLSAVGASGLGWEGGGEDWLRADVSQGGGSLKLVLGVFCQLGKGLSITFLGSNTLCYKTLPKILL